MNDSISIKQRKGAGLGAWLLLVHQIPPKPDYLRVKVRRRLQRIGALPLKNSVYVLPDAGRHAGGLRVAAAGDRRGRRGSDALLGHAARRGDRRGARSGVPGRVRRGVRGD